MARVGRKVKSKFVLCKELIILVVVIVAMAVTTICLSIPSKAEKELEQFNIAISEYNAANNGNISLLSEDTVFKNASLSDVQQAIAGSVGTDEEPKYTYVLYGNLKSEALLKYLSVIEKEAKQREKSIVYFYSSSKYDDQEDKEDSEFLADLEKDEEVFKETEEFKVDLKVTPAFYVYKNGDLVLSSIAYDEKSINWDTMINIAFGL